MLDPIRERVKVEPNGRITLPAKLRERLNIKLGSRIEPIKYVDGTDGKHKILLKIKDPCEDLTIGKNGRVVTSKSLRKRLNIKSGESTLQVEDYEGNLLITVL